MMRELKSKWLRTVKRDVKKREAKAAASSWSSLQSKQNQLSCFSFIWALMWESGKQLLHREWWDPYRDRSQIPLRLVGGGTGTQGESRMRLGQCICFCFPQHRLQNDPLGHQEGDHHRHNRFSCPSLNTSSGFAWGLWSGEACLVF